jgi:Icc protein
MAGVARMKLIVFSDIHLTCDDNRIIGLDPWERLNEALAHARAMHPDATHYVLLGDLAHHGQPRAYAELGRVLALHTGPVVPMLGNHDNREAFWAHYPGASEGPDGFVQHIIDDSDTRLIFLDTLADAPDPLHSGHLCQTRLNWFKHALQGAGARRVGVFMHHPPLAVGFPGMDAIALTNAQAFWDIASGRVDHLFLGHIHRTISGTLHGTGFTVFKSTLHQMPMNMTSSGTDLSVAEPGAYGIVLTGPDGFIAHSEDFTIAGAQPIETGPASAAGPSQTHS